MNQMRVKFAFAGVPALGIAALSISALSIAMLSLAGCGNKDNSGSNGTNNTPVAQNNPQGNNGPLVGNGSNNSGAPSPEGNNSTTGLGSPVPPTGSTPNSGPAPSKPQDHKVTPIAPSNDPSWSKVEVQAKDLATQVDKNLKALRDSKIHLEIQGTLPEGEGSVFTDNIVADDKRFLLQYAKFVRGSEAHWETFIVAKQPKGGYGTLINDSYKPGRVDPDPDKLSGWTTDMSHYIVSGIGTNRMPFTELVDAAQKAKWKIQVEDKRFDQGHFNRIVMESPNDPKKVFEVLIDPVKGLPVQFNADVNAKKVTRVSSQISYMKSDKPLSDSDLKPNVETKRVTPADIGSQSNPNTKVFKNEKS